TNAGPLIFSGPRLPRGHVVAAGPSGRRSSRAAPIVVPACPAWSTWFAETSAARTRQLGLRREPELRRRTERLPGTQDRVGERRLVRRVREVLGLEAEARPSRIPRTVLAGDRIVERVTRVELHGW